MFDLLMFRIHGLVVEATIVFTVDCRGRTGRWSSTIIFCLHVNVQPRKKHTIRGRGMIQPRNKKNHQQRRIQVPGCWRLAAMYRGRTERNFTVDEQSGMLFYLFVGDWWKHRFCLDLAAIENEQHWYDFELVFWLIPCTGMKVIINLIDSVL
jgi:hypothetical protein